MKDKQEVCQVGKQQQDYIPGRQNSMCRGTRQGLYSQIKKKRGGGLSGGVRSELQEQLGSCPWVGTWHCTETSHMPLAPTLLTHHTQLGHYCTWNQETQA
jgi:hypothetical protein